MTRDPLRPGSRPWPTVVLELLTCAAAGYGGVGLAWHNVVRMPDSWLQHGPFTSWQVPGLLLLLVVAVPMGLAAALELRRSPWAAVASVGAGAALVGWIGAELLLLQEYDVLQLVMLGTGLLVLLLAVWTHRERALLPPSTPTEVHRDELDPIR
jgi:hypothetical protein